MAAAGGRGSTEQKLLPEHHLLLPLAAKINVIRPRASPKSQVKLCVPTEVADVFFELGQCQAVWAFLLFFFGLFCTALLGDNRAR